MKINLQRLKVFWRLFSFVLTVDGTVSVIAKGYGWWSGGQWPTFWGFVLQINWVIGCVLHSVVPTAIAVSLLVLVMDRPQVVNRLPERRRVMVAVSLAVACLAAASIYGLVLGLTTTPEDWRDPRYYDDTTPLIRLLGWLGMLVIASFSIFALRRIWFRLRSAVSFDEKE